MSALKREAIGPFNVLDAVTCDDLTLAQICASLLPATWATNGMPQVVVDLAEQGRVARGQSILNRFCTPATEVAAVNSAGQLVAILVPAGRMELRPTKCFVTA